jgi:hypothetical protein
VGGRRGERDGREFWGIFFGFVFLEEEKRSSVFVSCVLDSVRARALTRGIRRRSRVARAREEGEEARAREE